MNIPLGEILVTIEQFIHLLWDNVREDVNSLPLRRRYVIDIIVAINGFTDGQWADFQRSCFPHNREMVHIIKKFVAYLIQYDVDSLAWVDSVQEVKLEIVKNILTHINRTSLPQPEYKNGDVVKLKFADS